jgi:hypothetical protein
VKEGSENRASLNAGARLGVPGGLLCWVSGKICGEGLRGRAFLSVASLLESLVGCSSAGYLCKLWRPVSLSFGAPWNTWERVRPPGSQSKEESGNVASLSIGAL